MLYLLIAFVLTGCAAGITGAVRRSARLPLERWGGRVRLSRRENDGFAFGFLRKIKWLPKIVTALCAVALTVFAVPVLFCKGVSAGLKTGIALLLAGAWANVSDRLLHGAVTDYLSLPRALPRGLRRVVFNLADLFLLMGAIVGAAALLLHRDG